MKKRLPQSALTRSTDAVRIEWGTGPIRPRPMLDRPGVIAGLFFLECIHEPSLLQNTRLSSNEANPLSRSRN